MRRAGTLPKFMTKYCVPRYGTSFEAEHRHERADETGNVYGQVFSRPLIQGNYRSTSVQWTISEGFDWFIFSNLGFVGAPWNDFMYEEDYVFSYAKNREHSLIHGGYFSFSLGFYISYKEPNAGTGHYIVTGKEIIGALRVHDIDGRVQRNFGPNHIYNGYYFWGDERKDLPDPNGTTAGVRPRYLVDNSAFSISPRRFSVYDGYWLRSYHAGKPIDNPVQSSWSAAISTDRAMLKNLAYDSFAGDYSAAESWDNTTHLISKNSVIEEEGAVVRYGEDSAEIVIFGYNGHGEHAFAQELGKMLDFGTYQNPFFYPQSAKGRHCLLGDGIIGSTQFALAYVSPELDGYETVELPQQNCIYSLMGVSTEFTIVAKNYAPVVGGILTGYEYLYDMYYRLIPVVTNSETKPNVMAFGAWYVDMISRVATDMDTSEVIDFSGVLPPNDDENAWGYSSGAYGNMALCVYGWDSEDGIAYIVSKYAVYKLSYNRTYVYESEKLMAYPSLNHVREFVLIRDQVIYKIREDGFEAYDMQTFLRLDNLPGFQSAVEKVWGRG